MFDHLLDCAAMQRIFQEQLPGIAATNLQIKECRLLHSHYYTSIKHPHKARLGLCYQLSGIDHTCQRQWTQLFYAKARADGQSAAEFEAAQATHLAQPEIGEPFAHLPAAQLIVWAFPNDPALPHLAQMNDCQQVKAHLPYGALPKNMQTAASIQRIESEVIHYYPEERCTSRYTLYADKPLGADSGQPEKCVLFGKTFKDESGEAIYRRLCEAWQYTQANPGRFRVAQALGYAAQTHTVWLRAESGLPLAKIINAGNAASHLASVAKGLVALQQSDLPTTGALSMAEQLEEIGDKVQKLAHALPDLAPTLHRRLADLCKDGQRLSPIQPRLIHGDFHIRQLLADHGEIVFLDFDEFALGDPLRDVANFVVDLHYADFAPDFVRQMMVSFLKSYRQSADFVVDADRLRWQLRYLFLTKAYRAYRQHKAQPRVKLSKSHFRAGGCCL